MTFKKKLASNIKSKKVNVFILFLILALLFSVLTKLSKDYTQTITFNVKALNVPEGKVIIKDSLHVIDITLTTYGFALIKYYFSKPFIEVNFNNLDKNELHYFWIKNKELPRIVSQFDDNIKIESVNPDTLFFRYDVNEIKKIPIVLNSEIKFSPGYDRIDNYNFNPDSIKVIGPKVLTDSIKSITTEKLKLDDVNSNILKTIQLVLPKDLKGVQFSQSQVIVSVGVEKFTEGSMDVPVSIINIPEDIKINYYPKTVSVQYYTSLSSFKTITSGSFIVECDYNELDIEGTYLIPKIVQQPKEVKNLKLIEKRIEFIIVN